MEARIDASLAQLREDMAKRETESVKRETESVKRDKQQLLAIAGLIGLATAIIGVMIASF